MIPRCNPDRDRVIIGVASGDHPVCLGRSGTDPAREVSMGFGVLHIRISLQQFERGSGVGPEQLDELWPLGDFDIVNISS